MVAGPALLGIVGLGAVGGILANIALTPLTAGASLLQSYWYGSGLILGERMMYTVHWEQIKGRLDKGEDFLQVLDKIMNDDITAIANLSFKAMDVTGKLYINKAGDSLASLIETLLESALNPFPAVNVEVTPPPPTGEDTPSGISFTNGELEAMTLQQLQSIINNAHLYTDTTVAFAKTIKLKKLEEEQQQQETTDIIQELFSTGREVETLFLQTLITYTTHTDVYSKFIPHLDSQMQDITVKLLRAAAMWLVGSIRTETAGSNETLRIYRLRLNEHRRKLVSMKTNPSLNQNNFDTQQRHINSYHILIWIHQLVYSR